MDTKRKADGGGDCYEAALNLLTSFAGKRVKASFVVHGMVFHPETGWHSHAWVEVETTMEFPVPNGAPKLLLVTVYDKSNGHNTCMPRDLYYRFGCVREPRRYTMKRAIELALKTDQYGPWED
jgi:hypothetical protein